MKGMERCLIGMERGRRGRWRRTRLSKGRLIGIAAILAITRQLRLRTRRGWRQGRGVRLVVGALLAGSAWRSHLLRRLRIHTGLLVALRRRRILTLRLLLGWVGLATARRQRLTVRAVQLSIRWRVVAAPHGMRRHKSLRLGRHGREDTLLREANAVGAASVFGLIEARAADLQHTSQRRQRMRSRAGVPCVSDNIDKLLLCADEELVAQVGTACPDADRAARTCVVAEGGRGIGRGAEAASWPWRVPAAAEQLG